jgi:hypothetical protein
MLQPPYEHHLNLIMQTVATILLWAGTAATLGWAGLKARREQSVLPVVLVVAVAVGSILEPIYDITYHLLWYTGGFVNGDITGHQWTLFTAFGLPQPVWVMPAYVMVFGLPALIMYDRLATKPSAAIIAKMAGTLFLTTAAFETIAINVNLYGYYGEAPLRLMKYPLWIAVMESAQITGFAILCAVLKRRKTAEVQCLALFAIFPANFGFDVLGAGFPTLIATNVAHPSQPVMWLSALASIALAATALWWTAQLLLREPSGMPAALPLSNVPVDPAMDRESADAHSAGTA